VADGVVPAGHHLKIEGDPGEALDRLLGKPLKKRPEGEDREEEPEEPSGE
jgi:hypothetical protein